MFETIAHLFGEGFELLRRASTPDAVRRRLLRQRDRAYRRWTYYYCQDGVRAFRKAKAWEARFRALGVEIWGTP